MNKSYKEKYIEEKISSLKKGLSIPGAFLLIGIIFIPSMVLLNTFEWGYLYVGGTLAFLGGINILTIKKEIKKYQNEKQNI